MAHEDRQLLERSAAGDRAAFGELVERHAAGVFQYARWIVGNDNDAEDVLQQTFLAAWSAAGDARAVDGARPWLVGIARRFATKLNVRRGESRARERSFEELGLEELGCQAGFGDERHTPELVAAALEERECLAGALAALEPDERELLVLRDLQGLSGAEVAALLGIGLAAQKSRLHRARLRLAIEVRRRMGSEASQ